MNKLEFVAALVKSLAWPLTALAVLLVIRKPLYGLIPSIEGLRIKDVELKFAHLVDQTKEAVGDSIVKDGLESEISVSEESLQRLASDYPRGAILEAWILLETTAIRAARRVAPDIPASQLRISLVLHNALRDKSLLTSRQTLLLKELRRLRNAAAHAPDLPLSEKDAMDYVNAATRMARLLEQRGR